MIFSLFLGRYANVCRNLIFSDLLFHKVLDSEIDNVGIVGTARIKVAFDHNVETIVLRRIVLSQKMSGSGSGRSPRSKPYCIGWIDESIAEADNIDIDYDEFDILNPL